MRRKSGLARFLLLLFLTSFFHQHQVVTGATFSARQTGREIRLLYATFDPLVGEPDIPLPWQAPPGNAYALLQFHDAPQGEWGAALQQLGVTFYNYLPEHTYLVYAPPAIWPAVALHPAVRWIGPYHPAYKLSPTLNGDVLIMDLFPGVDVNAVSTAAAALGAVVQQSQSSERGGLIILQADALLFPLLARLDGVRWLQEKGEFQEFNDDARWVVQSNRNGLYPLHERGLSGAGQVGGAADSGLAVYDFGGNIVPQSSSCYFSDEDGSGAALPPGPDHRKIVGYSIPPGATGDYSDATGHGSHVVGSIVGSRAPWDQPAHADGIAYGARLFFQDISLIPGYMTPPNDFRDLFADAYDPNGDGVYQPALEPRTHSNSWGSATPLYTVESAQTDDFMWLQPDFLILFAAGNQGPAPGSVGYPANAKNIVSVGATENGLADSDSMAYYSSRGPGPLGRLEPTVSAPGDRILSAVHTAACGTADRSGTSMATPIVQGIALLMRQYLWDGYYPTGAANPADQHHPSAALLKALLISSGRAMSGAYSDNAAGGSWPSHAQGWGRVTAADVLYLQGDRGALWLHDEYALDGAVGLATPGETRTFTFNVGDGQPFTPEPLQVVLNWTDYPGLPAAGGALVNDLDLTVLGPDGVVYRGNDPFTNDFRGLPDLPLVAPDRINPWEVVYLAEPAAGAYTVTVTAANLPSRLLEPARNQGFALVVTGDLISQQGRVQFEYPVYDANPTAVARLRLTDLDLSSNPLVEQRVDVRVINETSGGTVKVRLTETAANSGVFSGAVNLIGPGPGGGGLRVNRGDWIVAHYQDRDNGQGVRFAAYSRVQIAPLPTNLVNPPLLQAPSNSNPATLNWTAVANDDQLLYYVVETAAQYSQPLFDDAEGSLSDNWTAGQFPALWSADSQYAHSPGQSYWSGRGDAFLDIDTSLTLNHDLLLPADLAEARLTFYSRFYNGLSDTGRVEISPDNGATWTTLLRLYARPYPLPPPDWRLQYHQLDLNDYRGAPFRIRFRFDNGVISYAPESPGWWVDDISVSGATWRAIATLPPDKTSYRVEAPDRAFYRVQAVYRDGQATAWSNVVAASSE